jgi:hypothetical protein
MTDWFLIYGWLLLIFASLSYEFDALLIYLLAIVICAWMGGAFADQACYLSRLWE